MEYTNAIEVINESRTIQDAAEELYGYSLTQSDSLGGRILIRDNRLFVQSFFVDDYQSDDILPEGWKRRLVPCRMLTCPLPYMRGPT